MKKKLLVLFAVALVLVIPAWAVFNEADFAKTLSILRSELHQENAKIEQLRARLNMNHEAQHEHMVDMIQRCNELSLILYSQNMDYTFDMTYALEEVTREYNDYNEKRLPYDEVMTRLSLEIERYEFLVEALRRLPPVLDKIDVVPDSLSSVMDTILVHEMNHHHELEDDFPDLEEEAPFFLDAQGKEDRDSCLAYALNLLGLYMEMRNQIEMDNDHYEGMNKRLEESYNFACKRYRSLQHYIFVEGQDNYLKVLKNLPRYTRLAIQDTHNKYSVDDNSVDADVLRGSEWRGPLVTMFIVYILAFIALATLVSSLVIRILGKRVERFQTEEFRLRSPLITLLSGVLIFAIAVMIAGVTVEHNFFRVASGLLLVYAWLLAAILVSLLIRIPAEHIRKIWQLYLPVVLLGLIVITFRVIFIPNRLVNLIFPPIMLGFTIWQYVVCRRVRDAKEARGDMLYAWISFAVMLATTVIVWAGYVLLGIQIFIWWLFQLTAIETITALYLLVERYDEKYLTRRKLEYKKTHTIYEPDRKDAYIAVTWLSDFVKKAVLPILTVLSIPACLWFAAGVFDLTEICRDLFFKPFFNLMDKEGNAILHLSLYKLVLVSVLFFIFRYLSYVLKAFYRRLRFDRLSAKENKTMIHDNEINFTLANNVIGILVWGTYIVIVVVMLRIPMGALSIVAAGLATGLGLAMKDILNNFIYGIQLMSGRLRVGDYIECDGIRGKVTSISYQTTQIETLEDTLIAFTNTTLFNKNFKNLTRGSAYEFVKVVVGVSYGTDVEKVRAVLLEASQKLLTKDKYGRNLVDPKRGISVTFENFGDSSIDIAMKQYVLVEERFGYMSRARELIYNTLSENGITIPFPQRDVHLVQ